MKASNDYRTLKAAQVEEAVKILKSLNQALNQIPNTKVDVEGYKDTYGLVIGLEAFLENVSATNHNVDLPMGKLLALELCHGRKDPEEKLDDWGADGPIFVGLDYLHSAYLTTFNMGIVQDGLRQDEFLSIADDLICYDGIYYGDFTVFLYDPEDPSQDWVKGRIRKYDPALAVIPPQWGELDQTMAVAMGWGIFNIGNDDSPKFEIQRVDEPENGTKPRFDSDEEARAWVKDMARVSGSIFDTAIKFVEHHRKEK